MDHFNLETLAVSFSIAYVIFAALEKKVCWWFGLAGSLIYIFIFYDVNLYMESLLSVYYASMAVCGLFVWAKSENKNPPSNNNLHQQEGDRTQSNHHQC